MRWGTCFSAPRRQTRKNAPEKVALPYTTPSDPNMRKAALTYYYLVEFAILLCPVPRIWSGAGSDTWPGMTEYRSFNFFTASSCFVQAEIFVAGNAGLGIGAVAPILTGELKASGKKYPFYDFPMDWYESGHFTPPGLRRVFPRPPMKDRSSFPDPPYIRHLRALH